MTIIHIISSFPVCSLSLRHSPFRCFYLVIHFLCAAPDIIFLHYYMDAHIGLWMSWRVRKIIAYI